MQANELISSSIITISPESHGEEVLKNMDELKITHLPVVNKNTYFGLISENEILDWESSNELIKDHIYTLASPHVFESQHLFDIIKVLEENSLSIVPVLNKKNEYLGAISNKKLLYTIAKSSSVKSIGSIIVLEINQNDYNMTEISRIIESNNTKILSSYITSITESTKIELTLKLNKTDIKDVINDLERFKYKLMASFSESSDHSYFVDRYEMLMRYLKL